MEINQFLNIMQKIKRFQIRLEQENITGEQQQIILKIYIQEFIPKINIDLLEVI